MLVHWKPLVRRSISNTQRQARLLVVHDKGGIHTGSQRQATSRPSSSGFKVTLPHPYLGRYVVQIPFVALPYVALHQYSRTWVSLAVRMT